MTASLLSILYASSFWQSSYYLIPAFSSINNNRRFAYNSINRCNSVLQRRSSSRSSNSNSLSNDFVIDDAIRANGPQYSVCSPWNNTLAVQQADDETVREYNRKQFLLSTKFRQHVNPLKAQFRLPCNLPHNWPQGAYQDCSKPLYLDIGCGKGGFVLKMAAANENSDLNFLGLEIRPSVAEYAQTRVLRHYSAAAGRVSFVGCNVNVDLDRLLSLYETAASSSTTQQTQAVLQRLVFVSIQFPDPHFKKRHKKRKVVDDPFVQTLAKHMVPDDSSIVFLQSDIQEVLDDMRLTFRQHANYFQDTIDNLEEYIPKNPTGIPTEREVSVLEKNLPVFRCFFRRNRVPFSTTTASSSSSIVTQE